MASFVARMTNSATGGGKARQHRWIDAANARHDSVVAGRKQRAFERAVTGEELDDAFLDGWISLLDLDDPAFIELGNRQQVRNIDLIDKGNGLVDDR